MKKKDIQLPGERRVDAVVVSDIHLGTYGCQAKQLVAYLKSISPEVLILNGDIIDIWQFSKSYFPKSHLKVIRHILKMMESGTKVYYLAGNHDEVLRRFVGLSLGNLFLENKIVLELDGKKSWIFHGDVFDVVMHHSKWLAKLGAVGYGLLTQINRLVNALLIILGQQKISLSRDVKTAVKSKKTITTRFEKTVSQLAIKKGYEYAICGHIHRPEKKTLRTNEGTVTYLNSGDWVENLTALEYYDNDWHLVYCERKENLKDEEEDAKITGDLLTPNEKILFKTMFKDVIAS